MESITFQYPTWYILFCALLGIAFATFLYFRDKRFREKSNLLNGALGLIRFLTVTLLSLLLLTPLLKSLVTEVKKPVVIIAQDQSESVMAEMDEGQLNQYRQSIQTLTESLQEDYEIKQYAFGNEVREGIDFAFDDKVSNISELLKSLYDLYSNQNLGAVVLATDGIYNEGSNPIYASTKLAAPIYTVALGDTTPSRDLILKRVFHNNIAYLGDKFSIQVDVSAQNCSSENTNLNIYSVSGEKTTKLQGSPISINKNDFFTTKEIILDANRAGVQRYRISLSKVNDEVTIANNTKDIFVDVLDARQKILILANAPHPDLSALKQSVANNKNYEVDIETINNFKGNVAAYDFVILHQLPSLTNDAAAVISQLKQKKIPQLYIVGTQSNLGKISDVQPIININANMRQTNDVQAVVAPNFSLFTVDNRILTELPKFAPLVSPFGEYKANANTQVLLNQRIGKINTEYPLMLFGEQNDVKYGVLCAEGIWKWRFFDFMQNKNHEIFNELMSKSLQFLTLKEDKRKFRVSVSKNIFNENEGVQFDAELYNESYELINDPEATLIVSNSQGKDFNFTFSKTSNAYTLEPRLFPVGNYTFKGLTTNDGKELTYNGQFSVQPIQLELYETTADHRLLKLLSDKYGGSLVYPSELASVGQLIKDSKKIKPTIYQTTKTRSVINLKWIFFLLLGLLTLEWFLRRFYGSY